MVATAPAPARRTTSPRRTLASEFDPRRNALTLLRLGLAAVVAVTHALQISRGWQPVVGSTLLGDLAVDAFFVLSGYLIVGSYLRAPAWFVYAWHRFLRIMPAFWLCLLVTALVVAPLAALLSGGRAGAVFQADQDPAWRYPLVNAGLLVRQFDIGGTGPAADGEVVANGALWTLFYEALCYAGVLVLGLLGVLRRRRGVVLLVLVGAWLLLVVQTQGVAVFDEMRLTRFAVVFTTGAAARVFAARIPVDGRLAVLALLVLAGSLALLDDYRLLGAGAFAYLCLWAVVRLPLRWDPGVDLSYGIYIWHWPLAVLLGLAGWGAVGATGFVISTLVVSAGAAALSWYAVERPALRRKDLLDRWRPPGGAHRR